MSILDRFRWRICLGCDLASKLMDARLRNSSPSPSTPNPMGTLHGGVLCDLADATMGVAFASTLKPGESFTTLELKMNFLRPVWQETLRAEAKIVSRGRTVGLVECKVTDPKGRLMATASSTCLVLSGEAAQSR